MLTREQWEDNGTSTIPCACKVFGHSCQKCCTSVEKEAAKPLPESDEQWIQKWRVKEGGSVWMLFASDVRAYLTAMHSQHQAELAAAKEQGRREALQDVPVEALESALNAMIYERDISQQHGDDVEDLSAQIEQLPKLIESARDAQEKS